MTMAVHSALPAPLPVSSSSPSRVIVHVTVPLSLGERSTCNVNAVPGVASGSTITVHGRVSWLICIGSAPPPQATDARAWAGPVAVSTNAPAGTEVEGATVVVGTSPPMGRRDVVVAAVTVVSGVSGLLVQEVSDARTASTTAATRTATVSRCVRRLIMANLR